MKLDNDLSTRVQELAKELHRPAETILRDALNQYIDQYAERSRKREKGHERGSAAHPSGKPWPKRSPVGGIITPV